MKSAEWFWQAESHAPSVCGLSSFLRHRKAWGWLVWMVTKQLGVPGNSIPLGALQTFPLVSEDLMLSSVSHLKYWPLFWSQEWILLLTEIYFVFFFFFKDLILQLAKHVTGKVKNVILCRLICCIIQIHLLPLNCSNMLQTHLEAFAEALHSLIIMADPHTDKQNWRQATSHSKLAKDFTANWCGPFYNVPAWVLIEPQ